MNSTELPTFLEDWTYNNLLNEILEKLPAELDKTEGEFGWNIASPVAQMFAQKGQYLTRELLLRAFAETATGEYLEARTREDGVTKNAAERARTDSFLIEGEPGTPLNVGSVIVSTEESDNNPAIEFELTESSEIGDNGDVAVSVRAMEAGSEGNVPAGTITVLVNGPDGISNVENLEGTTGGEDEESDEELRSRYFEIVQSRITSGNVSQYRSWAEEITGVGQAMITRRKYGNGTVAIGVVNTDGEPASRTVLNRVQNYIAPPYRNQIDEGTQEIAAEKVYAINLQERGYWFASIVLNTEAESGVDSDIFVRNKGTGEYAQASPSEQEDAFISAETGTNEVHFVANENEEYELVIQNNDSQNSLTAQFNPLQSVFDDQEHDGVAPIDHRVYIEAAESQLINVAVSLDLEEGVILNDVQSLVEETISSYISDLAENDEAGHVIRNVIGSLILEVSGVRDYSGLTLNGSESNVAIDSKRALLLGDVTYG